MVEAISVEFIKEISKQIEKGKGVRRKLPDDGKINIDRKLPFLCLYRHKKDEFDEGIKSLVAAQSSYIIVSNFKKGFYDLIKEVTKPLSNAYNAALILEIWPSKVSKKTIKSQPPTFKIYGPEKKSQATIATLKEGLEGLKGLIPSVAVEVIYTDERHPPALKPLMTIEESKALSCLFIGMEVPPIYRDDESGKIYPIFLRKFKRIFSTVLNKAVFEFIRIQTKNDISHYHMLGRKKMDKTVWQIDKNLADVSNSFDFLMTVTPINVEEAWKKFKKDKYEANPEFHYRLISLDPELMKRELYNIPIDEVEDPTMAFLFRDKRSELDKQITMIEVRNTKEFLYSGLRLYGNVDHFLLELAEGLLSAIPSPKNKNNKYLNSGEFAKLAEKEFLHYKKIFPDFPSKIQIRKDVSGLMVSQGNLYIGEKFKVADVRANALIQHEVGIHVLTYCNGKAQPLQQLYCGLAGYDELQEGLAVLSEFLVGGLNHSRLRLLAARVVAVHALIEGADFVDSFRLLNEKYGFKAKRAFEVTARVYRGGGFAKDAIYLRGLVSLLEHLKNNDDFEPLFIGKIAKRHVPIIKELRYRKILHAPPLWPRFMEGKDAGKKLERIKEGMIVLNLIEKDNG